MESCSRFYNERMRSSFAKLRWGAGVCAVFLLIGSWAGLRTISATQLQQQPTPSIPSAPGFGEPPNPADPMQRQQQQRMEKARNVDRQKQLEQDTDKLLALAKELKEEVSKSNKDTLSIDVVKKAAEIEKLAKSVKDRMRG
jgi:succinate dehydrogenase/fumarate reductase flavoprotein subunit